MSGARFDSREAYLTEAASFILDEKLMPAVAAKGHNYGRPPFRVSVGWPKGSRGGMAVAQCFVRAASSDGVNEIFVSPSCDDPVEVLDHLTHELIHAIDNCASGHRNFFAAVARAAGLEGKFTSTHAGEELRAYLSELAGLLGDYPHKKMHIENGRKPGGTRQIKCQCQSCGFTFRASALQLNRLPGGAGCPACTLSSLVRSDNPHVRI